MDTSMYYLLREVLTTNQIAMLGVLVAFALNFLLLRFPLPFLPTDQGRAFAVNGAQSKGKIRGVGLTFVCSFIICSLLFLPLSTEYVIYCILLFAMMLSGYLDDASKTPWNDYKKGAIDLVLSLMTMWTFLSHNTTAIMVFGNEVFLSVPVYFILGVILLWVSINVTNCTDGVDGLCASLCIVVLGGFTVLFSDTLGEYGIASLIFVAVLLSYLYFNSKPSSMLMGDAGSRALGFYLAVISMKTGHPFAYILLALVIIVDGGIGLVKIFLLRFLKISILKNTLTPLHDHVRKNKGWSDTQVVFRFCIYQIILIAVAGMIVDFL
jgi:phospho-N-acetylmuramoyl-pentapeptide-transferase